MSAEFARFMAIWAGLIVMGFPPPAAFERAVLIVKKITIH